MPIIEGEKTEYDIDAICSLFISWRPVLTVLEKAQAFPGQGVSSMFSIGKGFGIMMGLLTSQKLPFTIVGPKTWQKEILRDLNHDTKQASKLFAQRSAPEVDWRGTQRSKIIHDGKTDSYCMAVYAKKLKS